MVFQRRPVHIAVARLVVENILFPIEMLGWNIAEYREEVKQPDSALSALAAVENALPNELSGVKACSSGSRSVAHWFTTLKMLMMDELFDALDAMTWEDLSVELSRIWTERKKTVIFVTHSIPEAVLLADRVVIMSARPDWDGFLMDLPVNLPRPREALETGALARIPGYGSHNVREAIYGERKVASQ